MVAGIGGVVFPNVSPAGFAVVRDRRGALAQWLYEVRSYLGRLASVSKILQVRPFLSQCRSTAVPSWGAWLGRQHGAMLAFRRYGSLFMRALRIAAVIMLMASPAIAQMPPLNLLQDKPGKTQEEKDADDVRQKAYKE